LGGDFRARASRRKRSGYLIFGHRATEPLPLLLGVENLKQASSHQGPIFCTFITRKVTFRGIFLGISWENENFFPRKIPIFSDIIRGSLRSVFKVKKFPNCT
jgi:hypothetical protein